MPGLFWMKIMSSANENKEKIKESLSRVGAVIAVMSGKGGVGKTTVSVNLAALLARNKKVALLDADVDCPNVNKFLNINEKFNIKNNEIIPIEKFGIRIVSFAFLQKKEDDPTIWRGPMLSNAILEIVNKVNWGDLDYLVIDLPPGTSDAALTIMQILKPDGMVTVTTPQKASVVDAKKSVNMARKLNIPVLGIIENMSGDIFGKGGGKKASEELNVDFLGELDLNKEINQSNEEGKPFILNNNYGFKSIVNRVLDGL